MSLIHLYGVESNAGFRFYIVITTDLASKANLLDN